MFRERAAEPCLTAPVAADPSLPAVPPFPPPEDHKLVFLQQGPLLLVAVSRTPQSAAQLRGELLAVHAQIVSTLTRASVARIFARKQNYDLRRLLAGSERTLDRLLDSVERDPPAPCCWAPCAVCLWPAHCAKPWVPCCDGARRPAWPSRCWPSEGDW